jgi:hypothetical protein
MGPAKVGDQENFEIAASYLQPTPGKDSDLTQRAKELQALHPKFESNIPMARLKPDFPLAPIRRRI